MARRFAGALAALFWLASLAHGAHTAPEQKIQGAESPAPLGELVELFVQAPTAPPEHWAGASYSWRLLEWDDKKGVFVEKKFRTFKEDGKEGIFFGTGLVKKKLLVVCAATHLFLVKDKDAVKEVATRTALLTAELQLGEGAPQPPPGPQPVESELEKALRKAYSAEGGDDKARTAAALAALYRQGAKTAGDDALKTYGELLSDMRTAARALGVSGRLTGLQSAIDSHLKSTALPRDASAALTDDVRKLAAAKFLEVALALEKLS